MSEAFFTRYEFRAERRPLLGFNRVALYLYQIEAKGDAGTTTSFVKELSLEPVTNENELQARRPTMVISDATAQELMDELWRLGCRPTEIGDAQTAKAMKQHLQDMRTLVFNKVGIPLPGRPS